MLTVPWLTMLPLSTSVSGLATSNCVPVARVTAVVVPSRVAVPIAWIVLPRELLRVPPLTVIPSSFTIPPAALIVRPRW